MLVLVFVVMLVFMLVVVFMLMLMLMLMFMVMVILVLIVMMIMSVSVTVRMTVGMSVSMSVSILATTTEEEQTQDVDHQTQNSHHQVEFTQTRHALLHLADIDHTSDGLNEDVETHGEQEHAVDHGTNHLETMPAVGVVLVLRTTRQRNGPVTNNQGNQVGSHVHSIGLESQSLNHDTADELHDHEGARQNHLDHQVALIALHSLDLVRLSLQEALLILLADVVLSLLILRLREIRSSTTRYPHINTSYMSMRMLFMYPLTGLFLLGS